MRQTGSDDIRKKGNSLNPPAATDQAAGRADGESEGGGPRKATPARVLKKGPWTSAEDEILVEYVKKHGEGNWNKVQRNTGLARCGKSCRLRWANHLRPDLKKGAFSREEEALILHCHSRWGNKWARMATLLPGRTDNEIKNYWNTRLKRLQRSNHPLYPRELICDLPITISAPPPPLGFIPGKSEFTAGHPPPLLDTMTFGAPAVGMAAVSPLQSDRYGQSSFQFSSIVPPPTPTSPTSLFQPPAHTPTLLFQPPAQTAFGLGNHDSTLSSLPPSFSTKVEGNHDTTLPSLPPSFLPKVEVNNDTTLPSLPPSFLPKVEVNHDTTLPSLPPSFLPKVEGNHDTTLASLPPSISPKVEGNHNTTLPSLPPYFSPKVEGNHHATLTSLLPSFSTTSVQLPSMYSDSQFGSTFAAEENFWPSDTGWSYMVADDLCRTDDSLSGFESCLLNSSESNTNPELCGTDFKGINTQYEPVGIPNPDSSAFYSIPDPTMQKVPGYDNINDIAQISNDQSSVLNIDYTGLDIDPSIVDQEWNLDSCNWSSMPSIF